MSKIVASEYRIFRSTNTLPLNRNAFEDLTCRMQMIVPLHDHSILCSLLKVLLVVEYLFTGTLTPGVLPHEERIWNQTRRHSGMCTILSSKPVNSAILYSSKVQSERILWVFPSYFICCLFWPPLAVCFAELLREMAFKLLSSGPAIRGHPLRRQHCWRGMFIKWWLV